MGHSTVFFWWKKLQTENSCRRFCQKSPWDKPSFINDGVGTALVGNKKEKSKLTPCVQPCPPSHQRNLNRSRLTLPQRYHSPRQNATHIMHKDKECFLVISTEKPPRAIIIRCPPYFFGRAVSVGDGEGSFSKQTLSVTASPCHLPRRGRLWQGQKVYWLQVRFF